MPYTAKYLNYFKAGHEKGAYQIKTHKVKGPMFPDVTPPAFRENIPAEYRTEHRQVDVDEMNQFLLEK